MLRVDLRPSRYVCVVLIAVHTAVAAIVAPLELLPWSKGILLAAVGVSLVRALRRHAWLRSADAITAMEFEDEKTVVRRRDGRGEPAHLLGSTYISPFLTVLNLRVAGNIFPQHVIIVADNVEQDTFRRLRVWLRWAYSET
jgi:toxin CptA